MIDHDTDPPPPPPPFPPPPPPTALIDFPKLEPGHVWLMAVLVSLSREPLNPDSLADAGEVVARYKQKFGF